MKALFEDQHFLETSSAVCPEGKKYLDPFQFNFIINTPGQTVAHHIDGVYFWGLSRFQVPQWLLAAMKFSGMWDDLFVNQVQVVSYLHNWTDDREGKFVFWTENGEAKSMNPTPRSANVVDGSKVVHAATVYRANFAPPVLSPLEKNSLNYLGDEKWVIRSNGKDRRQLTTDDLRISIVYRAKCFRDKEEADKYRNMKEEEMLTLDSVLEKFTKDLIHRGALAKDAEISQFDLGMLILKTYIKYPLPPVSKTKIPYNYCALPRLFPITKRIMDVLC
jgi:hypothetical protein